MEEKNLSDLSIKEWREAADEEHVKELLRDKRSVNPFYMSYLKDERPSTITLYLQMWQAEGKYVSPMARKWLNGGR